MQINKKDVVMTKKRVEKPKPIYWVLLCVCVVFYKFINIIIVYVSQQKDVSVFDINKSTLSGFLAQAQTLTVIFIALNPIRRSHWVGILLCSISAVITLQSIIISGTISGLPGVLGPVISIFICIIISNFKERSRKSDKELTLSSELLQKVLDTIPMPIFWKDLNSNFLGCNQIFANESGKSSPEELIG